MLLWRVLKEGGLRMRSVKRRWWIERSVVTEEQRKVLTKHSDGVWAAQEVLYRYTKSLVWQVATSHTRSHTELGGTEE